MDDAEGTRICRRFLYIFFAEVAQSCIKYYNVVKDLSYAYRENQLYSALIPALARITNDSLLVENPVWRKPRGKEESPGRMDCWAYYNNYSFAIEVKHSYTSLRTARLKQYSLNRYMRAISQLRSLNTDQRRRITEGNGLFLLALLFSTFYISSLEKNGIRVGDYDLVKTYNRITNDKRLARLTPPPNIFGLWEVPEEMAKAIELDNYSESYPALGIVGYAERVT
jgi:hypothetical protein